TAHPPRPRRILARGAWPARSVRREVLDPRSDSLSGMPEVTVLHNPRCSTSRAAMDEAARVGVPVQEVRYLDQPLDRHQLLELIDRLDDPATDLVRRDAFFTSLGLTDADVQTADQVAELLAEHPRLMQRPVLIRGERAMI